MRTSNIVLVGLLAYFGFTFWAKKKAADALQYFVQKVSFRFDGITPILDLTLGIENPTSSSLNLASVVGQLFVNSNYIADISSYQLLTIAPASNSFLTLSARLSLSGLIGEGSSIVSAIVNGNYSALIGQTITFKGYINAEGVTMPLEFTYKVL